MPVQIRLCQGTPGHIRSCKTTLRLDIDAWVACAFQRGFRRFMQYAVPLSACYNAPAPTQPLSTSQPLRTSQYLVLNLSGDCEHANQRRYPSSHLCKHSPLPSIPTQATKLLGPWVCKLALVSPGTLSCRGLASLSLQASAPGTTGTSLNTKDPAASSGVWRFKAEGETCIDDARGTLAYTM